MEENLTFADIAEPNVLQSACTLAVDALQLPGADDNIGDRSAIVENEHRALIASVSVGVAVTAAIKLLVAEVDATGNDRRRRERDDRPRASGDVKGLSGGESCQRGEKSSGVQHFGMALQLVGESCLRICSLREDDILWLYLYRFPDRLLALLESRCSNYHVPIPNPARRHCCRPTSIVVS